jgi:hypothetical protein
MLINPEELTATVDIYPASTAPAAIRLTIAALARASPA